MSGYTSRRAHRVSERQIESVLVTFTLAPEKDVLFPQFAYFVHGYFKYAFDKR